MRLIVLGVLTVLGMSSCYAEPELGRDPAEDPRPVPVESKVKAEAKKMVAARLAAAIIEAERIANGECPKCKAKDKEIADLQNKLLEANKQLERARKILQDMDRRIMLGRKAAITAALILDP